MTTRWSLVLPTLSQIPGLMNFNSNILLHQKLGLPNSQLERFHFSLLLIEAYMVLVAIACGYDCCGSQTSFQYLSFTVWTWFHWWPWLFESSIWSEWLFNEWKTIQFPSWSKPKDVYKTSFSACTAYASWGHLGWGFWEDKAWGCINQWLGWWIL